MMPTGKRNKEKRKEKRTAETSVTLAGFLGQLKEVNNDFDRVLNTVAELA